MSAGATPFQWRCMESCKGVLESAVNDRDSPFEFREAGQRERYYVTALTVAGHKVDLYIYQDEAELMIDDGLKDYRFEKWDYKSGEELIDAFCKKLCDTLAQLQANVPFAQRE